jgi:hypothetical protein
LKEIYLEIKLSEVEYSLCSIACKIIKNRVVKYDIKCNISSSFGIPMPQLTGSREFDRNLKYSDIFADSESLNR